MPTVDKFLGIMNKPDPTRVPVGGMLTAENVDIDDAGSIRTRKGQSQFGSFGGVESAYTTNSEDCFYIVEGTSLKRVEEDQSSITLKSDLPVGGTYYWAEAGDRVYVSGSASGMILNNEWHDLAVPTAQSPAVKVMSGKLPAGEYRVTCVHVDPIGREGAAPSDVIVSCPEDSALQVTVPQVAGYESSIYIAPLESRETYKAIQTTDSVVLWDGPIEQLTVPLDQAQRISLAPPVNGKQVAVFRGSLYMADPNSSVSYVYYSQPYWHHLFNLYADFVAIPGEVRMMAETRQESGNILVIGTDSAVYAFDGDSLSKMAEYGVVSGRAYAWTGKGQLVFWTERGACSAMPFANLTDSIANVEPGELACASVIEDGGYERFVVTARSGGTPNNQYD